MDKKKIEELRNLAQEFSKRAYAPYSKALVGAAVLAASGKIYGGHNIENSSYGLTTCAEQVAILKAVSEGERKISCVYVYTKDGWPPCGICRQMMSEFKDKSFTIILGDEKGQEREYSFSEIMPLAFCPEHLNS